MRKTDDLKYGCVADFLGVLDTGDAKRKRKQLDSWKIVWPKKHFKSWKAADLKSFAEFKAKHGGGSDGVGASERACRDIFEFCNKP